MASESHMNEWDRMNTRFQVAERLKDGSRGLQPTAFGSAALRRGATPEDSMTSRFSFNRRSATRLLVTTSRGLKPTATVTASLREVPANTDADPLKTANNLGKRMSRLIQPFIGAVAWASCLIFVPTAGGQITNQTQRSLSLRECLEMALAHNLDIQIERYSPQITRAQLGASEGIYDPILTLNASRTFTRQPGTFDPRKLKQTKPTLFAPFTTNTLGQEWPTEKTLNSACASLVGSCPNGLPYSFFSRC